MKVRCYDPPEDLSVEDFLEQGRGTNTDGPSLKEFPFNPGSES